MTNSLSPKREVKNGVQGDDQASEVFPCRGGCVYQNVLFTICVSLYHTACCKESVGKPLFLTASTKRPPMILAFGGSSKWLMILKVQREMSPDSSCAFSLSNAGKEQRGSRGVSTSERRMVGQGLEWKGERPRRSVEIARESLSGGSGRTWEVCSFTSRWPLVIHAIFPTCLTSVNPGFHCRVRSENARMRSPFL